MFDAVQQKLSSNANARELKLKASPSILLGRLFDDRGNKMTPSHTNKHGARYRYYVSHAILQKRKHEADSVTRVPAHEIETAVFEAVRQRLDSTEIGQPDVPSSERELIEWYIERITIKSQSIEIQLIGEPTPNKSRRSKNVGHPNSSSTRRITVPWAANGSPAAKVMVHSPSHKSPMSEQNSAELLTAIAKARVWIDDLAEGRVASFDDIARKEGKVERHIRLLALLAFASPEIVPAIAERAMPALKVTQLAKIGACLWAAQINRLGH